MGKRSFAIMTQGLCPGYLLFCWSQGFPASLQTAEGRWFGTATLPAPFHIPSLFRISLSLSSPEFPFASPWGACSPLTSCSLTLSHLHLCFPLLYLITALSQVAKPCLRVSAYTLPSWLLKPKSMESPWLGSGKFLQN